MMKKLFWLVLSTVILTGQSIFAQEADSESNLLKERILYCKW